VNGFKYIKEVYHSVDPDYNARFTIPVLYDKKLKKIVNNESSEIIRILNTFPHQEDAETANLPDLYPEHLREEIDKMNEHVYHKSVSYSKTSPSQAAYIDKLFSNMFCSSSCNNAVYKTGFAATQAAYDENIALLFGELENLESHLAGKDSNGQGREYLCGPGQGVFTEADLR
jgi:putative glutathione S-transferase